MIPKYTVPPLPVFRKPLMVLQNKYHIQYNKCTVTITSKYLYITGLDKQNNSGQKL